jgi:hypothetical protein
MKCERKIPSGLIEADMSFGGKKLEQAAGLAEPAR